MILYNIPPGLSPQVQMYERNSDDTVGSAVGDQYNGTGSGTTYTFDIENQSTGDFYCVLTGVSDPVASAFPVRDDVAYPTLTWGILDMITLTDAVVIANVTQPTAAKERLVDPIIIGDDYLASVGRNFEWQVNAISGYTAAELTCKFGGQKDGVGWLVTGTVMTITGGISLKFDLPKASTQDLEPGYYAWSVEVSTTVGGIEVTRVVGKQPVQLVEKQT